MEQGIEEGEETSLNYAIKLLTKNLANCRRTIQKNFKMQKLKYWI